MNVILLERIGNLGKLGETVQVKSGYGRNFLIPQGKAVVANPKNTAKFEERRAELEKVEAANLSAAKERAAQLDDIEVIIVHPQGGNAMHRDSHADNPFELYSEPLNNSEVLSGNDLRPTFHHPATGLDS